MKFNVAILTLSEFMTHYMKMFLKSDESCLMLVSIKAAELFIVIAKTVSIFH